MEETVEDFISCCIICLQNIPELKPSIDDGYNEGARGGDSENLKAALDLFGRLLNNGGTSGGERSGNKSICDNAIVDPTVCCGSCTRVLGGIWRLEEVIQQNRVWQMEYVEILKNLIVESALETFSGEQNDGRFWRVVCDLLMDRLNSHQRHRINFTSPSVSSPKEHTASVALRTISPMSKRRRGRPRKHEDDVKQNCLPVSTSPGNVKSCSVGLQRLNQTQIQQYTSHSPKKLIKMERSPSPVFGDTVDYAGSADDFEDDGPPPNKKRKERKKASTSRAKADDSDFEGDDGYPGQQSDNDNFLPGSASEEEDEKGAPSDSEEEFSVKTPSKKGRPRKTKHTKSLKKRKFECETCGKAFPAPKDLNKHMGTHLPMRLRKKYVCPVCVRKVVCIYSLKDHMERCHQTDWSQLDKNSIVVEEGSQEDNDKEKRRTFSCETCGKEYLSRSYLRFHIKTHLPTDVQEKFLCPLCDEKLLNRHGLRSHLKIKHKTDLSQFDTIAVEEGCQNPDDKKTASEGVGQSGGGEGVAKASKVIKNIKVKSDRREQYSIFNLLPTCDNFLMYKYTIIKHDYNQRLNCHEPGCSFIVEGTDFKATQRIREHIQELHWPKQSYRGCSRACPLCPESGRFDGVTLRHHIEKSHGDLSSICDICWRPMQAASNMRSHVWTHKNEEERAKVLEKEAEAGVIPKELAEKATLEKSWKTCFPRKPVWGTDAQEEAESFERKRQKEKSFICQECGKSFYKLHQLLNHSATHLPNEARKNFKCPYCDVQVLSKASLQSHIIRRHKPDVDKYHVCHFCDKKFHYRDKHLFQSHMRKHTGERPFQCDQCGKGFTSNGILICHRKTHEVARPFQCEHCPLNFKFKHTLTRHRQRAHKDMVPDQSFTGQIQPDEPGVAVAGYDFLSLNLSCKD